MTGSRDPRAGAVPRALVALAALLFAGASSWAFDAEQEAKLLPLAPEYPEWDLAGTAVALDGTTAVVGAPDAYHTPEFSGAAYVFTRDGHVWGQLTEL